MQQEITQKNMQFHHNTLIHIANYLNQDFKEAKILACFSQNKNEVVIETDKGYLRVGCNTPLTFIVPMEDFSRAGRNSVDLLPEVWQKKTRLARVVPYERVLIWELENGWDLVLKMHRALANVIVRKAGKVVAMLNKQVEDEDFVEKEGDFFPEKIAALQETVFANEKEVAAVIREISPIYDKHFARHIFAYIQQGKSAEEAFLLAKQVAENDTFYISKEKDGIHFQLFPSQTANGEIIVIRGIETALHFFLRCYFHFVGYKNSYKTISRQLIEPVKQTKHTYQSFQKSISQLLQERSAEEIGHIMMANLHQIPQNVESVTLEDFYHENQPIEIRIKKDISAAENAARYYQKNKDRKAKLAYLQGEIGKLEEKVLDAEIKLEAFGAVVAPEDLKLSATGLDFEQIKPLKQFEKAFATEIAPQSYPFRYYEKEGWQIFVGKNSKNNDELVKFGHKDDIWMHAKDVGGSHVLIRQQAGKILPKNILEYAAGLAAWYSKYRTQSLVPVIYTPRKYVRKRKGDPAGMVVVSREQVVMVEPVDGAGV